MTTDTSIRQQAIIDWFDRVYANKGDRYLRPTRAYFIYLELLQAKTGLRLLDVACGLGRLLEAAREYGVQMSGIDLSEVAVNIARKNVPEALIEVDNAELLPFADEAFDLVTCIGSLERLLDVDSGLAEMHRVGTPDARYCLLVRNSQTLSWKFRSIVTGGRSAGNANADSLEKWTQRFELNGLRVRSVLADQYPLHVRAQWTSMFQRPVDFKQAIPAPLDGANEFLFLLEKST